MRSLIKKFISMTLAITFLFSAISLNVIAEDAVHTVSATEMTRIAGEEYTASTHPNVTTKSMSSTRYGVAIWYQVESTSTKYTVSYDVDVQVAGYYKLTASGNIREHDYISSWTIYANDVSNTVTSYTKGETYYMYSLGNDNGAIYNCGSIYLEEGRNTIYWSVGKAKMQNQIISSLEYIELTPPPMLQVSATEKTKIEGEAYTGAEIEPNVRVMNKPDDGQKAVNYVSFNPLNYSGKKFIIEYKLNVAQEGDYKLNAVGSLRGQTYTSDWEIYIDTEENLATGYTQVADVDTTNFLQGLFKEYDCGIIHLEAGVHTLYWRVNDADVPNDVLQAAMDYFVLLPAVTVENPSLKLDDILKKGDSVSVCLVNGDGTEFGLGLFKDVEFSAEDERVLLWKDGEIFAANYGETEVTITLKDMKGTVHTLTKNVTVGSSGGIFISGAEIAEDGNVAVEISAFEDYSGGDKLLAVVYDTVDRMPTAIVSASQTETIPAIEKDNSYIINLNYQSINAGQKIAVFILSRDNENKAVYSKYIVNSAEGGKL